MNRIARYCKVEVGYAARNSHFLWFLCSFFCRNCTMENSKWQDVAKVLEEIERFESTGGRRGR